MLGPRRASCCAAALIPVPAYYAVYVTAGNGINVQYRTASGASAIQLVQIAGTVPTYLKVTRSGTTFMAYTSSNGPTWTPIAGSKATLSNLGGTILAGLAVTSHNGSDLYSVTLDSVVLTTS